MFQIGTVWINLGMSTDRFIAIHFPLKSLKFCTLSNAKKIILIIFLFSFLYSLPRYFEYHTKPHKIVIINNITHDSLHCDLTDFGKSRLYKKIVYVWMYVLFQSVVPLIILSVLNIGLIISLKESRKLLSRFSHAEASTRSSKSNSFTYSNNTRLYNKESKRKDNTLMLISVVIFFIILQTPSVICNYTHGFNYDHLKSDTYNFSNVCDVGNFFIITNSATNFFTYCLFNRRFRRELIMLLKRLIYIITFSACKQITNRFSNERKGSLNSSSSAMFNNNYQNSFKLTPQIGQKSNSIFLKNYNYKRRNNLVRKTSFVDSNSTSSLNNRIDGTLKLKQNGEANNRNYRSMDRNFKYKKNFISKFSKGRMYDNNEPNIIYL